MKISEFRALLGCTGALLPAVMTANQQELDATRAKIEAVHQQIDARKKAAQ